MAGEKLDDNYTRMLQAILNKSWRQNPTKQQLYGHLPSITKTIKVRWTRHAGHCWRSRDELISDELLWTPWHGMQNQGGQLQPIYSRTVRIRGVALQKMMNDWEGWWKRVSDIRGDGTTRWCWMSKNLSLPFNIGEKQETLQRRIDWYKKSLKHGKWNGKYLAL